MFSWREVITPSYYDINSSALQVGCSSRPVNEQTFIKMVLVSPLRPEFCQAGESLDSSTKVSKLTGFIRHFDSLLPHTQKVLHTHAKRATQPQRGKQCNPSSSLSGPVPESGSLNSSTKVSLVSRRTARVNCPICPRKEGGGAGGDVTRRRSESFFLSAVRAEMLAPRCLPSRPPLFCRKKTKNASCFCYLLH